MAEENKPPIIGENKKPGCATAAREKLDTAEQPGFKQNNSVLYIIATLAAQGRLAEKFFCRAPVLKIRVS